MHSVKQTAEALFGRNGIGVAYIVLVRKMLRSLSIADNSLNLKAGWPSFTSPGLANFLSLVK